MLNKYAIAGLIGATTAAPSSDQDYTKFPAFQTPVAISSANGLNAVTGAVGGDYIGAVTTGTSKPGYGPLRGFRNQHATFPTQTSVAIAGTSTVATNTYAVIAAQGTSRTFWQTTFAQVGLLAPQAVAAATEGATEATQLDDNGYFNICMSTTTFTDCNRVVGTK